jgi:hypothetical protein
MITDNGEFYLYRHIRLDKNEPFYIGIGTKNKRNSLKDSMMYNRGYSKTGRNNIWHKIVAKTDYEVEILLESDDYEFIKQKEIEFIALHGRKNLNEGSLINLTDGGDSLGYKEISESNTMSRNSKNLNTKLLYEDKIFKTNNAGEIKILNYVNHAKVLILFLEGCEKRWVTLHDIKRGVLKNKFKPNVLGKGYIGGDIKNSKAYSVWGSLMNKYKKEKNFLKHWYNFKNFEKWFEQNYNEKTMIGWVLYSKIENEDYQYTEEDFYFLPLDIINQLKCSKGYFQRKDGKISAKFKQKHLGYFKTKEEAIEKYKNIKKQYMKDLANDYINELPENTYNRIINYETIIVKHLNKI